MDTSPSTPAQTPDAIAAQLRDLERQGGELARLAHISAGLLLVAFSAGSLLSISHAAFLAFLAAWRAGHADIPDGISLVVNLLLVLAADVALLYAASVLRVLIAAQAPAAERRVHIWAMVGASLLESATYLYLAWQFDRPSGWFLWAIVGARALAAPLFAAYLSMARPLPVAPRDVAYQAALASGKGVVRDVATLAADAAAPLERKVRIYRAASVMSGADRARFDGIVDAVALEGTPTAAPPVSSTADATGAAASTPERPPTGPGSPTEQRPAQPRQASQRSGQRPAVLRLTPDRQPAPPRKRAAARASGSSKGVRTPTASVEAQARAAWRPGMSVTDLQTAASISRNAAMSWRRALIAEGAPGGTHSGADAGQLAQ